MTGWGWAPSGAEAGVGALPLRMRENEWHPLSQQMAVIHSNGEKGGGLVLPCTPPALPSCLSVGRASVKRHWYAGTTAQGWLFMRVAGSPNMKSALARRGKAGFEPRSSESLYVYKSASMLVSE